MVVVPDWPAAMLRVDGLADRVNPGTTAATTEMVRLAVAVSGVVSESATPMVKLEVPAAVGVPEITPVLALSVKPAGRLPVLTLHVYGATPPLAASVCE
jgi:hypothetical protein